MSSRSSSNQQESVILDRAGGESRATDIEVIPDPPRVEARAGNGAGHDASGAGSAGSRRRLVAVGIGVAALVSAVVAGVVLRTATSATAPVVVGAAAPGRLVTTPGGLGPVQAAVDFTVSFDLPGVNTRLTVTQVDVIPGDHVTKGEPMLRIDPTPLMTNVQVLATQLGVAQQALAGLQGQLATAEAASPASDIGALESEVASREQLLQAAIATGVATQIHTGQIDLQDAETALAAAQDSLGRLGLDDQARVSELQAEIANEQDSIALDQQLVNVAHGNATALTSPITGDVVSVSVKPGESVTPGAPLVEVVDRSQLLISADIPMSEQPDVEIGDVADVTFNAQPGVSLTGKVVAIGPKVTNHGLTFPVIISAPNTLNQAVLVGSEAYVHVESTHQAAVTVPRTAVLDIDRDPTVFVVSGDGHHVAQRPVVTGAVDETSVEILSGLSAGERVVVAGAQGLQDGSSVRVSGSGT